MEYKLPANIWSSLTMSLAIVLVMPLVSAEVIRNLILTGLDVHVVTDAPAFVFTSEFQSPRLFLYKVLLD